MSRKAKASDAVLGLGDDEAFAAGGAGLHITDEELDAAFEFFDVDGTVQHEMHIDREREREKPCVRESCLLVVRLRCLCDKSYMREIHLACNA